MAIFLVVISSLFVTSSAFAQDELFRGLAENETDQFIILNPSDDSFATYDLLDPENLKGIKDLNFGDNKTLKLTNNLTNNTDEKIVGTPIIKFNLDEILSEEIDKANLLLYVTYGILDSDLIDIQLHLSENSWSENNVIGLNFPHFSIQPTYSISIPDPSENWISFDVTEIIKQNSGSQVSFVLAFSEYGESQKLLEFASKEQNPDFSPKIVIEKKSQTQNNVINPLDLSQNIDSTQLQQTPEILSAKPITLEPTDDSYIGYDAADPQDLQNLKKLNFGDKEFLKLWYAFHALNYTENEILTNAYLKFDLSDILLQDINSAKLRLFASEVDLAFDDIGVSVHSAESDWSESTLDGINSPKFTSEPIDIVMVNESDRWYEWEITEQVRSNVGSPLSLFMIFSEITNGTEEVVVFASKENPNLDLRPSLVINPISTLDENEADMKDSLSEPDYSLIIILGAVVVGIAVIFYIKKIKVKIKNTST